MTPESEWQTRKKRIDPKLDEAGWPKAGASPFPGPRRTEEQETAYGPADYVLWLDGQPIGIVEAKAELARAEKESGDSYLIPGAGQGR